MSGIFSITVEGGAELQQLLARVQQQLQQPRELMETLGALLEANIQERFDTKRDPNGQPWAPLAPATLASYAQQDRGARRGTLLERTRQMRNSLAVNASDDQVDVGMSRLSADNRWSIPLLHETGTERMPRRGLFLADWQAGTLGAQDEADLQAELTAWLDELFGE